MGNRTPQRFQPFRAACVCLLVAMPGLVQAQEAMPTAGGTPLTAPPFESTRDTLRLSDRIDRGPDFVRSALPCGGPVKDEDGKTDKKAHGEVWAGIGTRGYREICGVVCVPVGDNGAVTIAVDAGQINGWGGRNGRRR